MITLADFQKYEALKQELKEFLVEKCKEYDEAGCREPYGSINQEEDFQDFEFAGLNIEVNFMEYRTWGNEPNGYSYSLPLDILFDPDFKQKMRARFEEERERQRLALIEKRKQHAEELKKLREQEKVEEIAKLKELMRKYPEIVEEGV